MKIPNSKISKLLIIVTIIILYMLFRFGLCFATQTPHIIFDEVYYFFKAHSIFTGNENAFYNIHSQISSYLYSALLSPIFLTQHFDTQFLLIKLINIFLSFTGIGCLYFLFRLVLDKSLSFYFVLTAMFVSTITFGHSIMPENLLFPLITGFVLLLYLTYKNQNIYYAIASVILFNAAILTKMSSMVLAVAPLVFLITAQYKKQKILFLIILLVSCAIPGIIWFVRGNLLGDFYSSHWNLSEYDFSIVKFVKLFVMMIWLSILPAFVCLPLISFSNIKVPKQYIVSISLIMFFTILGTVIFTIMHDNGIRLHERHIFVVSFLMIPVWLFFFEHLWRLRWLAVLIWGITGMVLLPQYLTSAMVTDAPSLTSLYYVKLKLFPYMSSVIVLIFSIYLLIQIIFKIHKLFRYFAFAIIVGFMLFGQILFQYKSTKKFAFIAKPIISNIALSELNNKIIVNDKSKTSMIDRIPRLIIPLFYFPDKAEYKIDEKENETDSVEKINEVNINRTDNKIILSMD